MRHLASILRRLPQLVEGTRIAYSLGAKAVTVLAIFYGGQDYESLLREE
jgi:hypothetical protein